MATVPQDPQITPDIAATIRRIEMLITEIARVNANIAEGLRVQQQMLKRLVDAAGIK